MYVFSRKAGLTYVSALSFLIPSNRPEEIRTEKRVFQNVSRLQCCIFLHSYANVIMSCGNNVYVRHEERNNSPCWLILLPVLHVKKHETQPPSQMKEST